MDQTINRKKKSPNKALRFFFVLIVLYLVMSFGYFLGQKGWRIGPARITNMNLGKPTSVDFSLFWEAWNKFQDKSVTDTDAQKKVNGAISGMLSSAGDPYTVFFDKQENQRFRDDIHGQFSGIGIEIVQKNGEVTVVTPLADSPALKAGIKANDVVLSVDGAKTSDIGFEETINRIRGKEGSKVKLEIFRSGTDKPITVEITRAQITVKSVEWSEKTLDNKKFLYIKIRQFGDDTESLFQEAAKEAVARKSQGIILDVRNNPGGYLETAVNIASYFIKDGVIVSEKGKKDNNKDYLSTGNGELKDFNVVLLANGGSASASEILAGALKDRKESKIVGEKTFGKGSVQELIDLSDGSAIKVTVAKWYTPDGSQINGEGIEADIKISNDDKPEEDLKLNRALEYISRGK